jgi:activating signal cointegrator complex subunit 3
MLGMTSFEFVQLLIKKRLELLSFTSGQQKASTSQQQHVPRGPKTYRPSAQIQVVTEDDKLLEKLQNKERKKRGGKDEAFPEEYLSSVGLNAKELREEREYQLATAGEMGPLAASGTRSDKIGGYGQKVLLPEGTHRKDTKLYEEVKVPYPQQKPLANNERYVPVTDFDEWAQPTLAGFKTLNRIQSRIFETAYKSNENLLICAPTGAGKTVVALMTMLHEIGQHFINGRLHKENFKIVYVAPMKALAAEMTENFSKRLSPLGVICKELTGDMQLTKKELGETQVIVTTPEKWDVITRKSGDVALTSVST